MQEQRVDPRLTTAEEHAEGVRQAQVLFKLNHTMPYTDEYNALVRELFGNNLGEGGWVMPGLTGVCFDHVHIGKNVMIMNNWRWSHHFAWRDGRQECRRGRGCRGHQRRRT